MVTVEEYARIRLGHRDGLSIRQLAQRFQHSRRKIREILATPEPKSYKRLNAPPSILDPFKPIMPAVSKPKILELTRGEWIDQHLNVIFVGACGTGKTHLAISLGLAACRQGRRVRFFTAASLVNRLEEAQKQYQLDRLLIQLDKTDLLICDELGYLSFSRGGAELLFQVFADRYERRNLLLTSNLGFSDWGQVFQGERMTAALLDRLTHQRHTQS
jgi:DNA replication protein DnaC